MSSTVQRTLRRNTVGRAFRQLSFRSDWGRLGWSAFAAMLIVGGALLMYETRGRTLVFDEWLWVVGRRGGGIASLLHPYNGHLSLVPIALYKLLFATAGIDNYVPYRLLMTVGHLVCVLLVYIYAKRRVGELLALACSAVILFFGPAWEDILWPFQIAWTGAIAAGVAALLMLDRRDRRGDIAACILTAIALASTSVGIAVALGLTVEIALHRRRLRDAWIVCIPLALYVLWSLLYEHAQVHGDAFGAVGFVTDSAATSLSALFGVSGISTGSPTTTALAWGAPLATGAIAAMIWVIHRRGGVSPRAVALLVIPVTFWLLTAIGRSELGGRATSATSRYLYVGAIFVLLLAVELVRDAPIRWSTQGLLILVAAASSISNLGILRDAAGYLRRVSGDTRAALAALNLSQAFVTPTQLAAGLPGYPLVAIPAKQLLRAQRELGSPAYAPAQLSDASEDARDVVDSQTIGIRGLGLSSAAGAAVNQVAPSPFVDVATAGSVSTSRAGCITFAASVAGAGQVNQVQLRVHPPGVWLSAQAAQVSVGLRRFAGIFQPVGALSASGSAVLRIPADTVALPWHLQAATAGKVTVCPLAR